jgi:hypothetical protein
MKQRLSMITLGVANLERAIQFYERVVGWTAVKGPPGIAFFDLGGIVFSLYPHSEIAKDTDVELDVNNHAYRGYALAHNVESEEAVDAIFSDLKTKGAKILKEPEHVFWGGYSGYFSDPDGHLWEVAYNPHWTITDDGRVSMKRD